MLQKKLEINMKNYEIISERCKIGERNGKGKEYLKNTNIMIFESEYINGKKMEKEKNMIMMVN